MTKSWSSCIVFFFNDTATTEIYTLSLHDALPISAPYCEPVACDSEDILFTLYTSGRSEEHTSELQSLTNLVCRLLLVKKKTLDLQGWMSVPLSTQRWRVFHTECE